MFRTLQFLAVTGLLCGTFVPQRGLAEESNGAGAERIRAVLRSDRSTITEKLEAIGRLDGLGAKGVSIAVEFAEKALQEDAVWPYASKLIEYFSHTQDVRALRMLVRFANEGPVKVVVPAAKAICLLLSRSTLPILDVGETTVDTVAIWQGAVSSADPGVTIVTDQVITWDDILAARRGLGHAFHTLANGREQLARTIAPIDEKFNDIRKKAEEKKSPKLKEIDAALSSGSAIAPKN